MASAERKQSCETFEAGDEFAMDVCVTTRAKPERTRLISGQIVADFFHRCVNVKSIDREKFWIIAADSRLQPLALIELHTGGVGFSMVDVALAMRRLCQVPLATAAFFIHNHPSGDASPSAEDHRMASILDEACRAVHIKSVDHLIMTSSPDRWYGAREGGRG